MSSDIVEHHLVDDLAPDTVVADLGLVPASIIPRRDDAIVTLDGKEYRVVRNVWVRRSRFTPLVLTRVQLAEIPQ